MNDRGRRLGLIALAVVATMAIAIPVLGADLSAGPSWAGGPWVVGSTHPDWKAWMADGKQGKGHGKADAAPTSPEGRQGD